MTLLRIVARPLYDPARGVAPDAWRAETEGGAVLVVRTRTPFLDGARALLARGHDPAARITLRIAGSRHDSFEPVPLETVARFRVTEDASGSARFRAWSLYTEQPRSAGTGTDLSASGGADGV